MGLSFLSPLLLGGTALVAAPILLHLLMRRKPVPHRFPALRFLQQRAVRNRRRLRLSHLLLLFLRIAALLLLALALSRPVLRGAGWLPDAEGPVAAAFVFDTAPRMALREGNRTRLEQAAEMAGVLFEKLPDGSKVAVLDTSGGPTAFAANLAEAEARVARLDAATATASLPEAIAEARRLLAGSEFERREIYVFTDCSHGAWDGAVSEAVEPGALAASILYVDVAAEAVRNFAIESLELSGVRLSPGTPLSLEAVVAGEGEGGARLVDVEIRDDDGRYVRRGVKPAPLGEGGRATVAFELGGLSPGVRQGRVLIDGSDDLAADDVRSFTVEVGQPGRVLVAAARPADRNAHLLIEALAPAALRRVDAARFSPEAIDYADLDAVSWQGAEGVVMLDPPPLPDAIWEPLSAWVANGHGLVVWLGPMAAGAEPFNTPEASRLLGGRIVRVWRSPGPGNYLAPVDLSHPLMAAFRRVGDEVPWQDFPVARHWEFQPNEGDAQTDPPATVVVAYRNGLPAVLERRLGQGRVVVVTTPVTRTAGDPDAWNTLATGFEPWPFLILANETLLFAIDHAADRNVVVGRPAVLALGRRDLPTAMVQTPGGDDFPVAIDRSRGTVTVTATLEPGNYRVRAGGGADGVSDGFSANLDPAATDYRRLSPEDLAAVLGPDHRLARNQAELVRDVNQERVGTELFGWTILLAAVAMAADWIVANRFYAPRDDAAPERDVATEFASSSDGEEEEPAWSIDPSVPPPLPSSASPGRA